MSATLMFILHAVGGFFTAMFLVRTVMRFQRISFIGQLGQFVLATTNWAVVPLQKIVPGFGRLDLSALIPAWLLQILLVLLANVLGGAGLGVAMLPMALLFGLLGVVKVALTLLMWIVILGAVLSWVNPYSPLARPVDSFTRPFLAPIRRVVPLIANVDLSPLVLLLIIQVLMFWLP